MSQNTPKKYRLDWDIQQLIGNMLRFGVWFSAIIASIGGIIYLIARELKKRLFIGYMRVSLPCSVP